jgi:DMSO/TMAO reductase YedYZ molybdopterin-dependent catalytic subunit
MTQDILIPTQVPDLRGVPLAELADRAVPGERARVVSVAGFSSAL